MVRALAFNRIIRPTAMKNVDSWYEGTALVLESPQIDLAGQRVSELLCRLGESNIPEQVYVPAYRRDRHKKHPHLRYYESFKLLSTHQSS